MLKNLEALGKKVLSIQTPAKMHALRGKYRAFRHAFLRPKWVDHPTNIQIDTHNYCNLWMNGKGCIHCNVKPGGGWKLPRGRMESEMIEYIITYWSTRGVDSIAPYINGEPLLDHRLPWICDVSRENGLYVVVDTNGTLFDNRQNLVHPSMREVRFSFSAFTAGTYEKVHGAPLFREAQATIEWFLKHRYPNQYPRLYYITNRYNLDELFSYLKKWMGRLHITVFPLHEVEGIQLESTKTRPKGGYWNHLTKRITGEYPRQPYRPIDIYPSGERLTRHLPDYDTCQGTYSFSIAWNGSLLHCTDIPYVYNYGYIYDHDMLEVWRRRNICKLGHPACSVCNVRHPKHDEILRRHLNL